LSGRARAARAAPYILILNPLFVIIRIAEETAPLKLLPVSAGDITNAEMPRAIISSARRSMRYLFSRLTNADIMETLLYWFPAVSIMEIYSRDVKKEKRFRTFCFLRKRG